jgi:hypothetical protein
MDELEGLKQENAELREGLRKALTPQWFYPADVYERAMFDPGEVVEYHDFAPGKYAIEIACARPLPSIYYAVRVLTDAERDELGTDEYCLMEELPTMAEAEKKIGV